MSISMTIVTYFTMTICSSLWLFLQVIARYKFGPLSRLLLPPTEEVIPRQKGATKDFSFLYILKYGFGNDLMTNMQKEFMFEKELPFSDINSIHAWYPEYVLLWLLLDKKTCSAITQTFWAGTWDYFEQISKSLSMSRLSQSF